MNDFITVDFSELVIEADMSTRAAQLYPDLDYSLEEWKSTRLSLELHCYARDRKAKDGRRYLGSVIYDRRRKTIA